MISRISSSTMSSGLKPNSTKCTRHAAIQSCKTPSRGSMAQFLLMGRQELEKHLAWWETTAIQNGKESSLELLTTSLLPYKHLTPKDTWFRQVSFRSTMKIFSTFSTERETTKKISRKVHKLVSSLKDSNVFQ